MTARPPPSFGGTSAGGALLGRFLPETGRARMPGPFQDSLFRWQTCSGGPYRAIYDRRRARSTAVHPGWAPARLHADAGRVMVKALIKHLWRAWRDATTDIERPGQKNFDGTSSSAMPAPLDAAYEIGGQGPRSRADNANSEMLSPSDTSPEIDPPGLPMVADPASALMPERAELPLIIGIDAGGLDDRMGFAVVVQS